MNRVQCIPLNSDYNYFMLIKQKLWSMNTGRINSKSPLLRSLYHIASPPVFGLPSRFPPLEDLLHLPSFSIRNRKGRWWISLTTISAAGEETQLGTSFCMRLRLFYKSLLTLHSQKKILFCISHQIGFVPSILLKRLGWNSWYIPPCPRNLQPKILILDSGIIFTNFQSNPKIRMFYGELCKIFL